MTSSENLSAQTPRLIFLDCIRGLAAIAVVVEHTATTLAPAFANFHTTTFQLGQYGVSLFFLCSGFVIPYSLEKKPSLRRFWIGRFFRLYPLYWLSLFAALVLAACSSLKDIPVQFIEHPLANWLGNITMVQGFLGLQFALSPYWSLGYEMIFYVMVSVLFYLRLHLKTLQVVWILLLLDIANPIVSRFLLHTNAHLGLTFHFTAMFFGTLVYRWFIGDVSRRAFRTALIGTLFVILITNALAFWGVNDLTADGVHRFLPMTLAWSGAFGTFFFFFASRNQRWIGIFLTAGTISYSIYLIHPLVVSAVPQMGSAWLTALVWGLLIWFGSKLTFRFVELPAIAAGRKLIDRYVFRPN